MENNNVPVEPTSKEEYLKRLRSMYWGDPEVSELADTSDPNYLEACKERLYDTFFLGEIIFVGENFWKVRRDDDNVTYFETGEGRKYSREELLKTLEV